MSDFALRCIKYVSRSLIDGDLGELEALRAQCEMANPIFGITGALYYDSRIFFQVIEGHPTNVGNLYKNIFSDERHYDVALLADRAIERRKFGRWGMKFVSGEIDPATAEDFSYDRLIEANRDGLNLYAGALLAA